MPPLKLYDASEAIPEALRGSAVETKDGKFAVVEDLDVSGLTTALEKERQRAKDEEKARKALEKERDDLKRTADARAQGITEAQLAEIQKKEADARKPLEEQLAATQRENRKLKLTDRVKAKALEAGVMPDRIDKAMRDLDGRFDLTEDGNSIVLLDSAGKPTAEKWDDFLSKTYKTEAPYFFAGTGGSGSGTLGSEGNGEAAGTYDARAAGLAAAKEQIKTREANAGAFR